MATKPLLGLTDHLLSESCSGKDQNYSRYLIGMRVVSQSSAAIMPKQSVMRRGLLHAAIAETSYAEVPDL
jgi:hypothetical protein